MELPVINIAVIAPTGAGKTALISTVCDYIKKKSNMADGYTLEIENKAAAELNTFRNQLQGKLAAMNIEFDAKLIKGTQECTEYMFSINFEANGETIKQPFKILDIPGAYINNPYEYENTDEYKKFISHLNKSRILWIPIDTPILMETPSNQTKGFSEMQRHTANLEDFVRQWAQFAAKNNVTDYCDFVLVKCETYFSQGSTNSNNQCRSRFDESYSKLVTAIREENTEDKIACVAVETIGPIKVNKAQWTDDGNCVVNYTITNTTQKIAGADCLLNDALNVAKESAEVEINKMRLSMVSEAKTLSKNKEKLKKDLQDNIDNATRRKHELSNLYSKQEEAEREIEKKKGLPLFKVLIEKLLKYFFPSWGITTLEELLEKKRYTEACIRSVENEISRLKSQYDEIDQMQVLTSNELEKVQNDIAGIDKLIVHFEKLGNRTPNSIYYRQL
ncbi:MAG: hypothetical protein IKP73_15685 [Bacteroidales bacterium]|nr:hypothetical protein [Bacteroidales bacterium]